MTHLEIKAIEDAGRASMVWSTEGSDDETHYSIIKALTPALVALAAATALILFIL